MKLAETYHISVSELRLHCTVRLLPTSSLSPSSQKSSSCVASTLAEHHICKVKYNYIKNIDRLYPSITKGINTPIKSLQGL
jgi:hypothetical protein